MLQRLAVTIALLFGVATGADAATFALRYTTFADNLFPAVTVDAKLTTDDGSFYGGGGYLVTGISGTRRGVAITGLVDPFSEIFVPANPYFVDSFGITFTDGVSDYNLVRNNASFYNEFATASGDPQGLSEGRLVFDRAISVTAVPEPATWLLLVAGFGLTGSAVRHDRRRLTRAA